MKQLITKWLYNKPYELGVMFRSVCERDRGGSQPNELFSQVVGIRLIA